MGPSSKILASKSNSGLGRTDGGGLARAVSVYGCLRDLGWDLREPEAGGPWPWPSERRCHHGKATDVVLEREHQPGRAVGVGAC